LRHNCASSVWDLQIQGEQRHDQKHHVRHEREKFAFEEGTADPAAAPPVGARASHWIVLRSLVDMCTLSLPGGLSVMIDGLP
jgi:hypothetical protein